MINFSFDGVDQQKQASQTSQRKKSKHRHPKRQLRESLADLLHEKQIGDRKKEPCY